MMIRDTQTKAVFNTNIAELNKYKKEREYYRKIDILIEENKTIKLQISQLIEQLLLIEKIK